MVTFEKAYSKKLQKEVAAYEYGQERLNIHNDLECCECKKLGQPIANLHLRKKEEYFFATNPKSQHNPSCDHYAIFTDAKTDKLFKNKYPTKLELQERKTIATQTRDRLLKILHNDTNDDAKKQEDNLTNNVRAQIKTHSYGVGTNSEKNKLAQRKIDKVSKECEFIGRLLALYGKVVVGIESNYKHNYTNKVVYLKLPKDKYTRLSIYIQEAQAKELKLEDGDYLCNFVGIGKVILKDEKYLNSDFFNTTEYLFFENLREIKNE